MSIKRVNITGNFTRPAASPAAAVDGGQQYAVPEAPAVEVADEDIPF